MANTANGVQDSAIGTANLAIAYAGHCSGYSKMWDKWGYDPYLSSRDWSRGIFVQTETDLTHNISKIAGGESFVTLVTIGSGKIIEARRLTYLLPSERLVSSGFGGGMEAGRFSQLRNASAFLREEGISNRALRKQIIRSFGSDLRVETYYGNAYQYSGGPGPLCRFPVSKSRYFSTSILDDPIRELALPPQNAAVLLQEFDILPTRVLRGTAAPQNWGKPLPGGGEQIFVPNPAAVRPGNIVIN